MDDCNLDNVEAETSFEIQLYIYDLSRGLAQSLLSQILGKQIPGIWHTSIVAYNREIFFGGAGIESCDPGTTILGEPQQIIQLGVTEIPYGLFLEYIFSLGSSTYAIGTYDLFHHNCNNFTNEVANFLVGKNIPSEIVDLPHEILDTPLGKTLASFLGAFHIRPEGTGAQLSGLPQSSRAARQQSQQESSTSGERQATTNMAEAGEDNVDVQPDVQPAPRRKAYKYTDPLFVYKTTDGIEATKELVELVHSKLHPDQQTFLKEWADFIIQDNSGWSLGDEHLNLIKDILDNKQNKFDSKVTLLALKGLQTAAVKDEFVLLLHQDRKEHRLMSFLNTIEDHPFVVQIEICRLVVNLCSIPSSFDWLMYISEWYEVGGNSSSNCRVTTRTAVHSLLTVKCAQLSRLGLELMFNISVREVFEDIATELATAILQYLQDLPIEEEENVHLALTCLLRFLIISPADISALQQMLGPDLSKFKSKSERNDQLITEISLKMRAILPTGH